MKKLLIIICHFASIHSFESQEISKYEIGIDINPTIYSIEKDHVVFMKNEYESKIYLFEMETDFSRLFRISKNLSVQTSLNIGYQYYTFSNIQSGVQSDYISYIFQDRPKYVSHSFSFNTKFGINFKVPNIFDHSNYFSVNYFSNILSLNKFQLQTSDLINFGYINNDFNVNTNWGTKFLIYPLRMDVGINYHFNLNKTEKEKKTYLILGLNYEIYNSPDLYDFRLFSTIGFAYQFGEFKPMKKD